MRHPLRAFCSLLGLVLILAACDTEPSSLNPEDREPLPDPVLSDISPAGSALAGIDPITITGQNFSATPEANLVFFNNVRGTVLESTPTSIRVLPPNTPGEDIRIRVAVLGVDGVGAENYSNALTYGLRNAAIEIGEILGRSEEVFGIASASGGGAFLSVFEEGASDDVQLLAPEGDREVYFETNFPWGALAQAPDGTLYGARGLEAIFALPPGGSQRVAGVAPSSFRFNAITVGPDGTIWAGGNNTGGAANRAIYRIRSTSDLAPFPFTPRVRDLIVFEDGLWVLGQEEGGATKVWRFQISDSGLGTPEEVVTVFETASGTAYALAAAQDGTLYISTNAEEPILTFDGSTLVPLYPGIFTAPITGLAWGPGSILYAVRGRVFNAANEISVFPAIIQIETRRAGASS